jgi:cyclopropane fatty-acyl-phospholipid synthase-like methyltransferase
MVWRMRDMVRLGRLYLRRIKSEQHYYEFQEFQARRVVETMLETVPVTPAMTVMDYGCGTGGYAHVLAERCRNVVAVDYFVGPAAENFRDLDNVRFESADLTTYRGEQKDFLFCASVIEHIAKDKQSAFVRNLHANLKDGGFLYLSFPPFKSIIGGHLSAPFHYLPDRAAFWLTRVVKGHRVSSYNRMFGDFGLTKTSIQDAERLLLENGFMILAIRARFMPRWYSRLFRRNNFLNWHAEFLCIKESETEGIA